MRGSTTFSKRQKEQARLEKRQAKAAKRIERKQQKEAGPVTDDLSPAEDQGDSPQPQQPQN